jgi:IclR family acetate operon transcriptional repressor
MALHDPDGQPTAAISLAMPTARFDRGMLPTRIGVMSTTVANIERDPAAAT